MKNTLDVKNYEIVRAQTTNIYEKSIKDIIYAFENKSQPNLNIELCLSKLRRNTLILIFTNFVDEKFDNCELEIVKMVEEIEEEMHKKYNIEELVKKQKVEAAKLKKQRVTKFFDEIYKAAEDYYNESEKYQKLMHIEDMRTIWVDAIQYRDLKMKDE
jgi:hypothetical protein